MLDSTRSLIHDIVRDFHRSWKMLVLTDLVYKVITFIVLTPLVGILFRSMLALSGKSVLADQDILLFFLGPMGWLCGITVGSLWVGISVLEQAALMGVIEANRNHQQIGIAGVLQFAIANAWPVIQLTARLIVFSLLTIAPFLAVAGLVYLALLTDYDINYYLSEKPPVFSVAIAIGGIIVVSLLSVLLYLLSSWFFALPLILFEEVSPKEAFKISRKRTFSHRRTIILWIMGWALASIILSALATSLVIEFGQLLIPNLADSLGLLALSIGVILLLWSGLNLIINLLTMTSLATIQLNLYQQRGCEARLEIPQSKFDKVKNVGFRVTRTRLLIGGAAGIVIATTIGAFAIHDIPLEDNVEVTAHRGASYAAPENTMAAIKKAIEEGADWVEIDVQETADGEVVVFHDSDFMKLAGVNLKIWDATMEDLKNIDVGSRFAPEFSEERVPRLNEVLAECKGKIGVNIELKYYGHDKQLEQRVADIVNAHDMASEVVIMSLKLDAIQKMKTLQPNWTMGLLMSVSAGNLQNVDLDFLAVNASFASRRFVQSTQSGGREVYVWTVNDAATMSTMIGRGVNNLITDKPALARSVIQQRSQMYPVERLLLELAETFGVIPEFSEQ